MKCPYCGTSQTKVVDSRLNQSSDITRRRRECNLCSGRFTTYERVEEVMPVVIKKDGRREPYNRDKIFSGFHSACHKLSIGAGKIENIVRNIEKKIQSFGLKEIPSRAIGELVMIQLHSLHKVAYVRFASVYREFKDVDEFVAEIKEPPSDQTETSTLSFPFADSFESTQSPL